MGRLRSFSSAGAFVALAACSASGISAPPSSGALPAHHEAVRAVAGKPSGPTLYVWNEAEQSEEAAVNVYSNGGGTLLRAIGPPMSGYAFDDMTADAFGHLFLAYFNPLYGKNGPAYLSIYSNRGVKIVQRLRQGHPFHLPILDGSDNLFAVCAAARVCEYAAAGDQRVVKQQVIRRIALRKIAPYTRGVHDFAIDKAGDLSVNRGVAIQVFAPGQTAPFWQENPQALDGYNATAFDSKGDLYISLGCVTDWSGEIYEFAPNGKYPVRTLDQNDGIYCPYGLAVDGSDNLYVLQGAKPNVIVYPSTGSVSLRTITQGLIDKQSHYMAVGALGDLYVSNGGVIGSDPGSVVVYPPGGTTPIRSVTNGV